MRAGPESASPADDRRVSHAGDATDRTRPGAALARAWGRLHRLPGGTWLFSRLLGRMVPYTGTIAPHVRELRPGFACVEMRDRRRVRNHLRSVHAIAIANLGEVASGLAMTLALPPTTRGIVTRIEVEYLKKARGRLQAECTCVVPEIASPADHQVRADVRDGTREIVAQVVVTWRLAPI